MFQKFSEKFQFHRFDLQTANKVDPRKHKYVIEFFFLKFIEPKSLIPVFGKQNNFCEFTTCINLKRLSSTKKFILKAWVKDFLYTNTNQTQI